MNVQRGLLALAAAVLLAASPASAADKLKVAIIIEGELGDESFYDSANRGFLKAKGELRIEGKVIECNYNSSNYVSCMDDAARNYDLVLPVGIGMMDALSKVAPNYPGTDFTMFDMPGELGHVSFVDFKQNEGAFLAGALAAMMTSREEDHHINPEPIIGIVCGKDIPAIRNFIAGYEQGARYINPDIKILRDFTDTWSDPEKAKAIAVEQHKNGADVIFQTTGGAGVGVIAAAIEGHFYAIGVDSPQEYLAPDNVLASMVKRLDLAVYDVIKSKLDGTYQRGKALHYGLKEGGVGLSWFSWIGSTIHLVPAEIRFRLDGLASDIVTGRIIVDETTK